MFKNLIKIDDLSRKEAEKIIDLSLKIKRNPTRFATALKGKVIATLFFEPSTRTRLSFEAAATRLGAGVIGFADPGSSSYGGKGESLGDTIEIVSRYADLIVIRHPEGGAAQKAANHSQVPIINAGDGANDHPTQTLLDLVTIRETQKKSDNLRIAIVGDLKNGRSVRSLAKGLSLFRGIKIYFVSPPELKMKQDVKKALNGKVDFEEVARMEDVISLADIIYMIRIQKERFKKKAQAKRLFGSYILKREMLKKAKKNLKILHTLPRMEEVDLGVDSSPHAYYFEQARNGMYARMALLITLLK